MGERLLLILLSPMTIRPFSSSASRITFVCRGGINAPQAGQNFRRYLHRLREIASQIRERGQKQIAEAVPLETFAVRKAILEQLG